MGINPPEAQEELDRIIRQYPSYADAGDIIWLDNFIKEMKAPPSEKPKRGNADRAAEYILRGERSIRMRGYIIIALFVAATIIIPLVATFWHWSVDLHACMRFLGLTADLCGDYLHLIAD